MGWGLLLLGLAGACQKVDGPTLAEGQVLEMVTNKPVSNAEVVVYSQSGSGLHSGYGDAGTKVLTDDQGRFSIRFEAQKGSHYILKAFSAKGHGSHWGEEPALENGKNNRDLRLPVAAPAWVKIRIAQQPGPVPGSIHVWGPWYDEGYISTLDLRPADYGKVSYHVIDSTLPTKTVQWEVNFNGSATRYQQAFTVLPFDTAEVVVRY
ncbi:hypothetical protein GCM10022408_26600 [Hymenobacter fastidiosus]|uniref:Carboxypeptidase regulatory-like domain-containing protein n=2 Tax=Hymenobacter fastidiosus TaxID=486264 RepID=A0ABP7SJ80_9BACT